MLLADAIKQNNVGNSEALPKYLPTSFSWYNGWNKSGLVAPPAGCTAMTGWAAIYQAINTPDYANANAVIELANFKSQLLLKSTKAWKTVQDETTIGGGHFVADFSGNAAIAMQIKRLANGNVSMDLPPPNYNNHWWADPRGTYVDGDVIAGFVSMDLRVTDPAASGLIANCGIDWWKSASAPFLIDQSNNPSPGLSCWVKLTTSFRTICFYTFTDDNAFKANLPAGVTAPVVVPPPVTPPLWESVPSGDRTAVPGGFIYRIGSAITFVPKVV